MNKYRPQHLLIFQRTVREKIFAYSYYDVLLIEAQFIYEKKIVDKNNKKILV